MNLRILKKLSKRAAPYLPRLGDIRTQFPSRKGENYHGAEIGAPKHRKGAQRQKSLSSTNTPKKGTLMVGALAVGCEPEWDEECCWIALADLVHNHCINWEEITLQNGETIGWRTTRDLSTVGQIFRAADDLVAIATPSTTHP